MEYLPPYIHHLLKSNSYPHNAGNPELVQTHISFILLAGDYVYKLKKPVNFGFLDFSTLEKRKFFCERELTLNRRLCPDLYLDLVSVNLSDGSYMLDGPGQVVEYGIKMARMPQERMMGKLIEEGALTKEHLDAIINVLLPFYEKAEAGETISGFGRAEAVGKNVLENFDQTEAFIGKGSLTEKIFKEIKAYSLNILADTERFDRRVAAGRIRDCHGDLHSANICLADKVYIFDCIEFNERFRYSDVAADIAFLAMDLDYHGLPEYSAYFTSRFVTLSKDEQLLEVIDFYKCYRAFVRGKIGLFTAADPSIGSEAAAKCLGQAGRYFQLAQRYATAERE